MFLHAGFGSGTRSLTLSGGALPHWNHLSLATYAVLTEDLGFSAANEALEILIFEDLADGSPRGNEHGLHPYGPGKSLVVASDNLVTCPAFADARRLDDSVRQKFVMGHELGHFFTYTKDSGGDGCAGNTPDRNDAPLAVAPSDPCDGSNGGPHEVTDLNPADPHMCFGDPVADTPDIITDGDWLEDVTSAGRCDGGSGSLFNRSTQFDWLRYSWDMLTVQGVSRSEFWEVWDDADPHSWNPTDAGLFTDMAHERMRLAAVDAGGAYETAHNNAAADHGLDH